MTALLDNPTESLARRACSITGISQRLVFSPCRSSRASQIRFAAWHLARRQGWILEDLGEPFGRGHTSVIHGLRRARVLIKTDPWFRDLIHTLSA